MAYRHRPERDNDHDNSGILFNVVRKRLGLETDRALAFRIGATESTISKIRHGENQVTEKLIIGVYDETDLSIEEIRELISGTMPRRLKA